MVVCLFTVVHHSFHMPGAVLIGTGGTQTVHVVLALKRSLSAGRMDKRRLLSQCNVVGVPARLWVEGLGERV